MKSISTKIPYRETRLGGKDASTEIRAVGERSVSVIELPEGHESGMRYEGRICHCADAHEDERKQRKQIDGADEIARFQTEDSARQWYEAMATTLGGAKALLPPTTPGRLKE